MGLLQFDWRNTGSFELPLRKSWSPWVGLGLKVIAQERRGDWWERSCC